MAVLKRSAAPCSGCWAMIGQGILGDGFSGRSQVLLLYVAAFCLNNFQRAVGIIWLFVYCERIVLIYCYRAFFLVPDFSLGRRRVFIDSLWMLCSLFYDCREAMMMMMPCNKKPEKNTPGKRDPLHDAARSENQLTRRYSVVGMFLVTNFPDISKQSLKLDQN